MIRYLSQVQAQAIDQELMGHEFGYDLMQLMELAGLAVAQAVCHAYPPSNADSANDRSSVLVVCGPGSMYY
jgi:NAD(P)H-hydrate epimerase